MDGDGIGRQLGRYDAAGDRVMTERKVEQGMTYTRSQPARPDVMTCEEVVDEDPAAGGRPIATSLDHPYRQLGQSVAGEVSCLEPIEGIGDDEAVTKLSVYV